MNRTLLAFALTLASTAALAAGQVEVSFRPADQLSDVGRGIDRERNVKALADHFKSLAAQLPDGQALKVEVLDRKDVEKLGMGAFLAVAQALSLIHI